MNARTLLSASIWLALLVVLESNSADGQWVARSLSGHGERVNLILPAGDRVYAGFHGGIDQSFDGGLTWEETGSGIGDEVDVHALRFDAKGRMFMATEPGVYISLDSGRNWTVGRLGFMRSNLLALETVDTVLFAGSSEGLYLSKNGGRNWRLDSVSNPSRQINSLLNVRGVLFAGSSAGLFITRDTGRTWLLISEGLPADPLIRELRVIGDSDIFVLVSQDVYHSTDQGQSWSSVQGNLRDQQYFGIARYRDTLFASTQYGIFRSVVGSGDWVDYSEGIEDSLFYDIRFVDGRLLAAGNDGHVYTRQLAPSSSVRSNGLGQPIGVDRLGTKIQISLPEAHNDCELVVIDLLGTPKARCTVGSTEISATLELEGLPHGPYYLYSRCFDQIVAFIY